MRGIQVLAGVALFVVALSSGVQSAQEQRSPQGKPSQSAPQPAKQAGKAAPIADDQSAAAPRIRTGLTGRRIYFDPKTGQTTTKPPPGVSLPAATASPQRPYEVHRLANGEWVAIAVGPPRTFVMATVEKDGRVKISHRTTPPESRAESGSKSAAAAASKDPAPRKDKERP